MKIYSLYVWIDGSQSITKSCYNVTNNTTIDHLIQTIEKEDEVVLLDKEKQQLSEVVNGAEVSSFNHTDDFLGVYGTNIQLMKQQAYRLLLQMDLEDQRVISELIVLRV